MGGGVACEGMKKKDIIRSTNSRKWQNKFSWFTISSLFFPVYLRHVRASYVEFDLIVGENLEMT